MFKKLKNKKQKGFTLIEMVIVIAIIVMIVMLIAPNLISQKNAAQSKSDKAFLNTLQTQVTLYLEDHPGEKTTTFDKLKNKYLTEDQYEKASKNYAINVEDNTVVFKEK
ncbi:MAG: competence type IV pilus minor pilin ComGE [Lactobacillus sp.]|nr:competence type IV pilus minor pilin ComGE [Lactobacillus sp.]